MLEMPFENTSESWTRDGGHLFPEYPTNGGGGGYFPFPEYPSNGSGGYFPQLPGPVPNTNYVPTLPVPSTPQNTTPPVQTTPAKTAVPTVPATNENGGNSIEIDGQTLMIAGGIILAILILK